METTATNLLFITTDQQRFDSLPCYGLDFMQTPNIDRLAAEGRAEHERVAFECRRKQGAYLFGEGVCAGAWSQRNMIRHSREG